MKFKLTLLFCIIIAVISGSFLGSLCAKSAYKSISWLGLSTSFGFETKSLDLHVLQLSIGLHVDINVVQILLIAIALVIAPKIAASIKTS